MDKDFELEFSDDALLSRALFLITKKSISVFVEDTNKEYEYEQIFERLLPKEINISCIFPIGGKRNLDEAFDLFGNSPEYGKTFFIADGDFDVVLNKKMIAANNVVYLKRYNIESYLFDKDAVLRFMRPRLRKTIVETGKLVNYDNWCNTLTPFFKEIFVIHCLVQKHISSTKNVARGPAYFLNEKGFPNIEQSKKYREEIKNKIPNFEDEFSIMQQELEENYGTEMGCFECGKYYIGSLKLWLNSMLTKKINEQEIKTALIEHFDISRLYYVRSKLYDYINS